MIVWNEAEAYRFFLLLGGLRKHSVKEEIYRRLRNTATSILPELSSVYENLEQAGSCRTRACKKTTLGTAKFNGLADAVTGRCSELHIVSFHFYFASAPQCQRLMEIGVR